MAAEQKIMCSKCGKTKSEKEFYMKKDGQRETMCKSCITMFIDNKDPSTFMWILEKFDVPYIEETWINLANKIYKKNPQKFGPMSVLGQYLRTMNMAQYKKYTYADTDKLKFEADKIKGEAAARIAANSEEYSQQLMELQEKLDNGEISQAEFDTLNPLNIIDPFADKPTMNFIAESPINEDDIKNQLDEEDIKYLTLKWGLNYKPSQWIQMEDMYNSYDADYVLNTIDRKETVKQICRTRIKANEALEIGDINSYKSLSQVESELRKTGKFTEAQKQEEKTKTLDTIGELALLCEENGGIIPVPEIDPDEYPQDKIDFTIKDLKNYTYNLATNELNLGNMIESYIKQLEQQQKLQEEESLDAGLYTSIEEELEDELTEQEALEYQDYLENEVEAEAARLAELLGGDADGA